MESSLEIGFLRVTEKAAIAAARTMGYGKRKYSDQVAVEAMREELNKLKMRGSVVIGEGERDKAPMLYVGEPLGRGWTEGEIYPEVDIAVDPLEGTNLCATGAPGSIAVLERIDGDVEDRKSTRLNSSHVEISYAVFCWKKTRRPTSGSARVRL